MKRLLPKSGWNRLFQPVLGTTCPQSAKRSILLPLSALWLLTSGLTTAIIDTNENTVSDLWEKQYNNGELYPSTFDPQADPDQDGWTNAEEAAAGTDPQNPNPPDGLVQPEILHTPAVMGEENGQPVIITPAAVTLTWPTIPGKRYTLFYSPDLESSGWLPVEDPFIGQGTEVTYGFAFSDPETDPSALFWRIAVTDTDTDGDTLTDAEEHQLGTNRLLVDSDADGMADNVDPHPNSALTTFPDDDGDGIANADDSEPNTSAGFPPVITSDTATLSRIVNVVGGESVNFLVRVENPSGPAVTASDLKLFVSGTEHSAAFSSAGDNQFSVNWTAQTHANYPATILQNITVRFRDSRSATAWLELARIDVAEWQGMLAGVDSRDPGYQSRTFSIGGHADGTLLPPTRWSGANGDGTRWYRGPLAVILFANTLQESPPGIECGTLPITAGMRYPFCIINDGSSPAAPNVTVYDISDPNQYPHGVWGLNRWTSQFRITDTDQIPNFPTNTNTYVALPQPVGADAPFTFEAQYHDDGEWKGGLNNTWNLPARTKYRCIYGLTAFPSELNEEDASILEWDTKAPIEARMVASSAGTLEHPGLPIDHPEYHQPTSPDLSLYMAPNQWHRIVVKVGPDAAVVARGVRLRLNRGAEGTEAAQTGVELKLKTATGFENHTPGEILEGPGLYNTLTGPSGLVLFARITPEVTRQHRLTLDLLPNGPNLEPLEMKKIALVPVDVDDNTLVSGVDDVSITGDPTDIGYQSKFWIMAPAGNDPGGDRCSNSLQIKVPVEPGTELRMDCTHARCDYVKLNPPNADILLPPIPIGHGVSPMEVSWRGTGAVSGDQEPLPSIGNPQKRVDLPIRVKTMKRRTVRIRIHLINLLRENGDIRQIDSLMLPAEEALESRLHEVFTTQLNTWFELDFDRNPDGTLKFVTVNPGGDGNYSFNFDGYEDISQDQQEALNQTGNPPNTDIRVFIVANNDTFLVQNQELGYGFTSRSAATCWVLGFPSTSYNGADDVISTIAHEIGHVLVGHGHPDVPAEPGVAPLAGTDRSKRIMCSHNNRSMTEGSLLVKREWDEAESWLKKRPNGNN
jgi:hypothetical protein